MILEFYILLILFPLSYWPTYLIHDFIQTKYVIIETFILPFRTDIGIIKLFAIMVDRCVLYQLIQYSQFLKYLRSN